MKKVTLLLAASILTAAAITWSTHKAEAQAQPSRSPFPPQVVVLWAQQDGVQITSNGQSHFQYSGASIYCSSSSPGAPVYPQGSPQVPGNTTPLASALAELLHSGFHIIHIEPNQLGYTLVKDQP